MRNLPLPSRRAIPALLLCLALLGAACGSDDTLQEDTIQTDTSTDSSAGEPVETNATATVAGTALTPYSADGADAAVGQPAPTFSTVTPDGALLASPTDGATIYMFLVHWCPHCQAELPVATQWVADGNLPDGVEIIAVSTGFDPARGNWPPSAWFAADGWDQPIAVDAPGSDIAQAYGMTSFPYLVAVDAAGTVVGRRLGGGAVQLDELAALALAQT